MEAKEKKKHQVSNNRWKWNNFQRQIFGQQKTRTTAIKTVQVHVCIIREPIGIIKWHRYTVKEVKWRINGCQLAAKTKKKVLEYFV